MREGSQGIHSVQSGVWEIESEQGGYYYLCKLGVWIEFQVRNSHSPNKQIGACWTIDNWASYHDTPAFLKRCTTIGYEIWRIEIEDVITTGWRNGSIGGPNGEQPSSNKWVLWGANKQMVRCLPLGSTPPQFEFALYLKQPDMVCWENNQSCNFSLCLFSYNTIKA